ncbi:MAG: endolytic transglycosylase MltG [Oscillospiraceae bacterium]|nr:endolytic transglycosylase MltG [Oscillospiraceae bacterium]
MNHDMPTGAEQRARRQQAELERRKQAQAQQQARLQSENEAKVKQQAEAFRADQQRAEKEARRAQQAAAQKQSPPPAYGRTAAGRQGEPPRPPSPIAPRGPQRTAGPPEHRRLGQQHQETGGDPPGNDPPKVRNRWFTAMIMVSATLAACVFLSLFLVQSAFDLLGLNQNYTTIEVYIPQDADVNEVARILGQTGVVSQPLTFRMFMNFRSVQSEYLLAGDYVFNSQMSYDEIIRALMIGRTTREVVRLTFPEGWTLRQYAEFLEENGVVGADVFIDYLNTTDFGFEFFGQIERDPLRFHMLEGYLFPDTYDFYVGENVSSVTRKFLRNFNDRVMTPQLLTRMSQRGMTVDETITLASIIQREAGLSDDMRLVSSVFHNRLGSPNFPRLESDVPFLYIRDDILQVGREVNFAYIRDNIMPTLSQRDRDMIDAYNTYVVEGLPVGPVCNPGMDAIMAALYPESTQVPFFFFVTDVNGDFYYAANYERHQQNVQTALAAGEEIHGTGVGNYVS